LLVNVHCVKEKWNTFIFERIFTTADFIEIFMENKRSLLLFSKHGVDVKTVISLLPTYRKPRES